MKNNLSELIKSLSLSEKRYLKLYLFNAAKSGDTKQTGGVKTKLSYRRVYDLYEKKSKHPERVDQQLQKEGYSKMHISVIKNYLYKLILKSLRAYHEASSQQRKITNLLFDAKILSERQLFRQALKVLRQAEKLATKHEYRYLLIEVLSKQLPLIERIEPKYIEEKRIDVNERISEELRLYFSEKKVRAG